MGTNYYWFEKPPCSHCKRPFEELHIGKSSSGWCFSLHVIPELNINDLDDWILLWAKEGSYIENEYGEKVSPYKMTQIITERKGRADTNASPPPCNYRSWDEFFLKNSALPGPNGLVRHVLDSRHCIRHGIGTWDLIIGEFS